MKAIAITGGSLSGNMGAAAMLIVAAKRISALGYRVVLFSKYPDADAALAKRYGVRIHPANQYKYTFLVVPLLAFSVLIPGMRSWIRQKYYPDIDAFYDVGGITFSANRGITGFVINFTWLLVPLLLAIPLIKGSQAIGPFNRWYLRLSLPLLRFVKVIYARGKETANCLWREGIQYQLAPDIAFLLEQESAEVPFSNYITVVPSSVVMNHYDKAHGKGAYLNMISAVINNLSENGHNICLLAHSYKRGRDLNNNDYPVCQDLFEAARIDNVVLYDVSAKTPGQLKTVLSCSDVVFTSRFHAMIAALSSVVPVVVASWSHKYREVLDIFGLGEFEMPWQDIDSSVIIKHIHTAYVNRESISKSISLILPDVKVQAERNFEYFSHASS